MYYLAPCTPFATKGSCLPQKPLSANRPITQIVPHGPIIYMSARPNLTVKPCYTMSRYRYKIASPRWHAASLIFGIPASLAKGFRLTGSAGTCPSRVEGFCCSRAGSQKPLSATASGGSRSHAARISAVRLIPSQRNRAGEGCHGLPRIRAARSRIGATPAPGSRFQRKWGLVRVMKRCFRGSGDWTGLSPHFQGRSGYPVTEPVFDESQPSPRQRIPVFKGIAS